MNTETVILITQQRTYLWQPGQDGAEDTLRGFDLSAPMIVSEDDDLTDYAKRLAHAIVEQHEEISAQLIIPWSWTRTQTLTMSNSKPTEGMLQFEFENTVTETLESLVCSFKALGRHRYLGTAVFGVPLKQFLETLEDEGVIIERMISDAAALMEADCGSVLVDQRTVAFIPQDRDADLRLVHMPGNSQDSTIVESSFNLIKNTSPEWAVLSLDDHPVVEHVQSLARRHGVSLSLQDVDQSVRSLAVHADKCPADLRHGPLRHEGRWNPIVKGLTRAAVALTVMFIAASISTNISHRKYEAGLVALQQHKSALYQQVHPSTSMPNGAALRVRAERIRLEGLTEGTGPNVPDLMGKRDTPLKTLSAAVRRIPEKMKLFVKEITADDSNIKISGLTLSHKEVGELVQTLNESGDFEIEPPQSKLKKDQTVQFTVKGRRQEAVDE